MMNRTDNHGLRLFLRYLLLALIALMFCFPLPALPRSVVDRRRSSS